MAKRKRPARTKTWTMVETVAQGVAGWRWRAHLKHWLGRNPFTIRDVYSRADMGIVAELRIAESMREMVLKAAYQEWAAYQKRREITTELLELIELFETDRRFAKHVAERPIDTTPDEVIADFLRNVVVVERA